MSCPFFLFPGAQSSSEVVLTPEQIHAFHLIDRTLFSRFVFILNREMNESFEVFCFLYMIEQAGYARDLINYLVSKPDDFINSLANEIVVCLNFLYNKDFSAGFFATYIEDNHDAFIDGIVKLTRGKITLRFIHQNREVLLQELTKNMATTCRRALADLLVMRPQEERSAAPSEADKAIEEMQKLTLMTSTTAQQGSTSRSSGHQETTLRPMSVRPETAPMLRPDQTTLRGSMVRQETLFRPSVLPETTYRQVYRSEAAYRPVYHRQDRPVARQEGAYRPVYRQEAVYRPVVRKVTISSPNGEEEEENRMTKEEEEAKALEERTVFLTFSKGYHITEDEVRYFFTRQFGEVIEAISMQEVEVHRLQPLFAKMLLKKTCLSKMDEIVNPSKNKYTINGKHVWARKYIPKLGPFASSSSSSSSPI